MASRREQYFIDIMGRDLQVGDASLYLQRILYNLEGYIIEVFSMFVGYLVLIEETMEY